MRFIMHYLSACSITIFLISFGNSYCRSTISLWNLIRVVNVCLEPQGHRLKIANKERKQGKDSVKNAAIWDFLLFFLSSRLKKVNEKKKELQSVRDERRLK